MDYAGIAQKEKLTELQLRVRQLLAQVDQINKEQNYQRVSCFASPCCIYIEREHLVECATNIRSSSSCPIKIFYVRLQIREERFRQTSESTNQRVLWWSLTQTAILLVMGAWQMRHLKKFFEAKKLV